MMFDPANLEKGEGRGWAQACRHPAGRLAELDRERTLPDLTKSIVDR